MADVSLNSRKSRSKKFDSFYSLRFEKERLETFIDWPVSYLQPTDLARDGFYYLRTKDHCACMFCRGIVGAWKEGDTPRKEHQHHFPRCPFVNGQPVENVSLENCHISPISPRPNVDSPEISETGRHMPGSYSEYINIEGMVRHSVSKTPDLLTYESRLGSYVRWPERVKQKPNEMSEAGFYYCGLSDHVRCFHCGNGLRNWETDGIPWREHAGWYPNCNFVLLNKGQEFIDEVRCETDIDVGAEATEVIGMANSAQKPLSSNPLLKHTEKIEKPGSAPKSSNDIKVPCAVPVQTSTKLVEELEEIRESRESRMCKVCMDAEMSVVFLPCEHMVTCTSCALAIAQCPICREDIKYIRKPTLS